MSFKYIFSVLLLSFSLNAQTKKVSEKTKAKEKTAEIKPVESATESKPVAVQGTEIIFSGVDGKTEFLAIGRPAMIKIAGEGEGPVGSAFANKDVVNAKLDVDLSKLTTKIDLRDDHMKNKYLEVSKYPTATLELKDLKLPVAFDAMTEAEVTIPFSGQFTMRGKTKPVSGTAKVKKVKNAVTGSAEFKTNVTDYLDTLPTWLGIKIAETVDVNIKFKGNVK